MRNTPYWFDPLAASPQRGWRARLVLVLGVALVWPLAVLAQQPRRSASGTTGRPSPSARKSAAAPGALDPSAVAGDAAGKESISKDPSEKEQTPEATSQQVYIDPKAKENLDPSAFPELYTLDRILANDRHQLPRMESGQANFDATIVRRWIKASAGQLTQRSHVAAMLNPDSRSDDALAIESAYNDLIAPIQRANQNQNRRFVEEYTKVLLEVIPDLLKNNLYARIEALQALAQTGSAQAIDTFVSVLKDPNQPQAVQLLAAQGLTSVAQAEKYEVPPLKAIEAASVLADYLTSRPDAFWFVKVRVLEALGALRQGVVNPLQGQGKMVNAAMQQLTDTKARPEVRAWAAWALGMMRVNLQLKKYNYSLVAYHMGQAALDLGQRVRDRNADQPTQARHYTTLLVAQVYRGLQGEPDIRESGLINQKDLGPDQAYVEEIRKRVAAVGQNSVNLIRAIGNLLPQARTKLDESVEDLKTYLAKNPPKDFALVPGTEPEFPPPTADQRVAGTDAGRP